MGCQTQFVLVQGRPSCTMYAGSAAGKVIGEGLMPPRREPAGEPPQHNAPVTAPVTPLSDAIVGGGVMDPSKPSYGVML